MLFFKQPFCYLQEVTQERIKNELKWIKQHRFKRGINLHDCKWSACQSQQKQIHNVSGRRKSLLKAQSRIPTIIFKILALPFTSIKILGVPSGSVNKESSCNAGEVSSIPGSERSPGEGNCNPLQYSCLENSMDR